MTIIFDKGVATRKLRLRMNPRLWQARKLKGLSQAALAFAAEIDQQDISMIENDGWIPPLEIRQRLAGILEVSVEELFAPQKVNT